MLQKHKRFDGLTVFHDCRQLPCKTQVPDKSMLVFQAGLKLTKGQHFMPGLGDAPGSNICCPNAANTFHLTAEMAPCDSHWQLPVSLSGLRSGVCVDKQP